MRLWESGTVVIDGRVAPSADGDGHVGLVGGAPIIDDAAPPADGDDPFLATTLTPDAVHDEGAAGEPEPSVEPAVEPAPVAGERVDEFDELRAAFSSF